MIVRISSRGSSFKGLAAYLTHDQKKAATDERVAWTETLNCARDDVPGAVDEMLWTARDAELLKQEAGIRAGGRSTENPVKHISLNWSPEDSPSREHMVATSEDFLRHMKWDEHQAVLVAHDDKKYAHVHIMLNMIHPETGLRLNDDFERRRAQEWALGYERENGQVHCEQRLKDPSERQDAPPRNVWMAFQEAERNFASDEKSRQEFAEKSAAEKDPRVANFEEWKILKEFQQRERQEFFADGKSAFSDLRSSIYCDVREEFRDRWADYYAERKAGGDAERLDAMKVQLIADQREILESRRDEACSDLRESRNGLYEALLDDQRQMRAELRGRQEEGWDNGSFFAALEARGTALDEAAAFREAAQDVTVPEREHERSAGSAFAIEASDEGESDGDGDGGPHVQWGNGIGRSVGRGTMSFLEIAFRAIEGKSTEDRPKLSAADKANAFMAAADETAKREQHERDVADDEWRRRNQLAPARE